MAGQASHEVMEHVGELELRVRAPGLDGLLAEAGQALAEAMLRDLGGEPGGGEVVVELEAADRAALLVDFLNELIYQADATGMVLTTFLFDEVSKTRLRCRARGVVARADVGVKAATFHGLRVDDEPDGTVTARVILDI